MHQKIVVITGASGGIGAALADVLAKRGASLVLVARHDDPLRDMIPMRGSGSQRRGA